MHFLLSCFHFVKFTSPTPSLVFTQTEISNLFSGAPTAALARLSERLAAIIPQLNVYWIKWILVVVLVFGKRDLVCCSVVFVFFLSRLP